MATEYDVFRALEEGFRHMIDHEPIISFKGNPDKRIEAQTTFRAYGKVLTCLVTGERTSEFISYQHFNRDRKLRITVKGPKYVSMMSYNELLTLSLFLDDIMEDPGNYFSRESYDRNLLIPIDEMDGYFLELKPGLFGEIIKDIEEMAINIIYDLIAETNLYYEFVARQACTIGLPKQIVSMKEKELEVLRQVQTQTLERKRELINE